MNFALTLVKSWVTNYVIKWLSQIPLWKWFGKKNDKTALRAGDKTYRE